MALMMMVVIAETLLAVFCTRVGPSMGMMVILGDAPASLRWHSQIRQICRTGETRLTLESTDDPLHTEHIDTISRILTLCDVANNSRGGGMETLSGGKCMTVWNYWRDRIG